MKKIDNLIFLTLVDKYCHWKCFRVFLFTNWWQTVCVGDGGKRHAATQPVTAHPGPALQGRGPRPGAAQRELPPPGRGLGPLGRPRVRRSSRQIISNFPDQLWRLLFRNWSKCKMEVQYLICHYRVSMIRVCGVVHERNWQCDCIVIAPKYINVFGTVLYTNFNLASKCWLQSLCIQIHEKSVWISNLSMFKIHMFMESYSRFKLYTQCKMFSQYHELMNHPLQLRYLIATNTVWKLRQWSFELEHWS